MDRSEVNSRVNSSVNVEQHRADQKISMEDIVCAHHVLKEVIKETPLQKDPILSAKYGCNVYLKREDLQVVRSFKIRGAYHLIRSLPEEKVQQGIVCASAGNHAQGVAYS
jgi:threonine dehydratase